MTTRTASKAQSTAQPKGLSVGLVAVTSIFSMGAGQSISAGDVIQMIKVPKNGTIIWMGMTSNYVQAALSVGDGLSNARYLLEASTSAAFATHTHKPGGTYVPYTYSTDDTVDIFVSLVSVSSIAGAFNLTAIISMDP